MAYSSGGNMEYNIYEFEVILNKEDRGGRLRIDCSKLEGYIYREMSTRDGELKMVLLSCLEEGDKLKLNGEIKVLVNDYWTDLMKSEGREEIVESKLKEFYLNNVSWRMDIYLGKNPIYNEIYNPIDEKSSLRNFTSIEKLGEKKYYEALHKKSIGGKYKKSSKKIIKKKSSKKIIKKSSKKIIKKKSSKNIIKKSYKKKTNK